MITFSVFNVFGDYVAYFVFLAIISLQTNCNPSFLLVFADYQFTNRVHKIIIAHLGKLCGCFPCGAQAVVKDERVYQMADNHNFLLVFGDYQFTKKL
jgi:hypothetical protein